MAPAIRDLLAGVPTATQLGKGLLTGLVTSQGQRSKVWGTSFLGTFLLPFSRALEASSLFGSVQWAFSIIMSWGTGG